MATKFSAFPKGAFAICSAVFLGSTAYSVNPEEWNGFKLFTDQHVEINIDFDPPTGSLVLNVYNDDSGRYYEARETIFWIRDNHLTNLPANRPENLGTLGNPGDPVYLLPNSLSLNDTRIFHGLSSNGLAQSDLIESNTPLTLQSIEGPGDMVLFRQPEVYWDTGRPEGQFGSFFIGAGDHQHLAWAFNRRGIYRLVITTEGTVQSTGQPALTEPTSYLYMIDPYSHQWWQVRHFGFDAVESGAAMDVVSPVNNLSHLIAYAFDLDPRQNGHQGLPQAELWISPETQATHLAISHRRPVGELGKDDFSDLTYQFQGSSDLAQWTTLGTGDYTLIENGLDNDFTPLYLAVLNQSIHESPIRFLRFRLILTTD